MAVYNHSVRITCKSCHHELFSEQELYVYEKTHNGLFIEKLSAHKQYTCEHCGEKYLSDEFLNGATLI